MKNRSDHTPLLAGKESNISIILRKPLPRKPLHHYTILIGTVKGKTLGNLHKSLYSRYLWPVVLADIFARKSIDSNNLGSVGQAARS